MVQVTNYFVRRTKDDKLFITLELTGGIEMVQSQQTGKFYATVRKCTIPTTFDESIAAQLLGSTMSGEIIRTEVEPYEFTNPDTGEVMMLSYTWTFVPGEARKESTKPLVVVKEAA